MPRSSWSSKPTAVSRSSVKTTAPQTQPAPQTSPPPVSTVQHNVNVERPGFFSNMLTGFGLGAGQAIAHNIFRSEPVVKHVHEGGTSAAATGAAVPMNELPKEFVQCMKDNHNDTDLCKQFLK